MATLDRKRHRPIVNGAALTQAPKPTADNDTAEANPTDVTDETASSAEIKDEAKRPKHEKLMAMRVLQVQGKNNKEIAKLFNVTT